MTENGSLYVPAGDDVPPYSTTFWRPDQPLIRDTEGKTDKVSLSYGKWWLYAHFRWLQGTS